MEDDKTLDLYVYETIENKLRDQVCLWDDGK